MKRLKLVIWMTFLASFLTPACQPTFGDSTPVLSFPTLTPLPTSAQILESTPVADATSTPVVLGTTDRLVPDFSHIVIIIFENREYTTVVGNRDMPYFNLLASTYTLLNQHYAVTHPSLPNYLSLIGGDTFGITDDCDSSDCYINSQSLPDLIEASGRTWKTYQDDIPSPCFTGDTVRYVRRHNPFIFFDPIRTDTERCTNSIVPLTQMDVDIVLNELPNFIFITPDMCYSAHDCAIELADGFLKQQMDKIYPALEATEEPYLIILTWDEGQSTESCCSLSEQGGGRIATILISPQVKQHFQDNNPYSHYSILKTISEAWGLPYLGHAADAETPLITAPWK